MDDNESIASKEEEKQTQQELHQQPQPFPKPNAPWMERVINAGIIGGSESNIKQLKNIKKPEFQHKSDVHIIKYKTAGRQNATHEYEYRKQLLQYYEGHFNFF